MKKCFISSFIGRAAVGCLAVALAFTSCRKPEEPVVIPVEESDISVTVVPADGELDDTGSPNSFASFVVTVKSGNEADDVDYTVQYHVDGGEQVTLSQVWLDVPVTVTLYDAGKGRHEVNGTVRRADGTGKVLNFSTEVWVRYPAVYQTEAYLAYGDGTLDPVGIPTDERVELYIGDTYTMEAYWKPTTSVVEVVPFSTDLSVVKPVEAPFEAGKGSTEAHFTSVGDGDAEIGVVLVNGNLRDTLAQRVSCLLGPEKPWIEASLSAAASQVRIRQTFSVTVSLEKGPATTGYGISLFVRKDGGKEEEFATASGVSLASGPWTSDASLTSGFGLGTYVFRAVVSREDMDNITSEATCTVEVVGTDISSLQILANDTHQSLNNRIVYLNGTKPESVSLLWSPSDADVFSSNMVSLTTDIATLSSAGNGVWRINYMNKLGKVYFKGTAESLTNHEAVVSMGVMYAGSLTLASDTKKENVIVSDLDFPQCYADIDVTVTCYGECRVHIDSCGIQKWTNVETPAVKAEGRVSGLPSTLKGRSIVSLKNARSDIGSYSVMQAIKDCGFSPLDSLDDARFAPKIRDVSTKVTFNDTNVNAFTTMYTNTSGVTF